MSRGSVEGRAPGFFQTFYCVWTGDIFSFVVHSFYIVKMTRFLFETWIMKPTYISIITLTVDQF